MCNRAVFQCNHHLCPFASLRRLDKESALSDLRIIAVDKYIFILTADDLECYSDRVSAWIRPSALPRRFRGNLAVVTV